MISTKRILIFPVFAMLAVSLLSACGKKEMTLEDRFGAFLEPRNGTYEGVIEKLPSFDIYTLGTHMLINEDDEALLIQSATLDLSEYVGEEVLVEGVVKKGVGDAQAVFSVSRVEYLDASRVTEFSEFESKLLGFSFEYPAIWKIGETAGTVTLSTDQQDIISIEVFNDEASLDTFVSYEEEGKGEEVTIGAQRSIRFVSGDDMHFYVPNPPKKKIYLISYSPIINKLDDAKGAKEELNLFYDLLEGFQLTYLTQLKGDACGGLQQVECPESYRCELDGSGKYAEGICVPVGADVAATSCPFIAPPTNCFDYRILEYSKNGCPARFECVGEGAGQTQPTFRDLNVVDAGREPEEWNEGEEVEEVDQEEDTEVIGEGEPAEKVEEMESSDDETSENADYEVPDLGNVSREYVNSRQNFSLLYPKNWYYASFGPTDGSVWTVGFADKALEELNDSIIILHLKKAAAGSVSRKVADLYYTFEGPSDLKSVMQEMADSVEGL